MPRHTMLLVTIAITMHGMRIIAPTMHYRIHAARQFCHRKTAAQQLHHLARHA